MPVSRSAEYALRAVVRLAEASGRIQSTAELARHTRVPPGYLSKVLQTLARAGLVESVPGRTGGFTLSRPPSRLTVLDVVNAVAPVERIAQCPLGNPAHARLCPLHRRLDDVAQATERAFRQTSIVELIGSSARVSSLCDWTACLTPATRRRGSSTPPRTSP